MIVFNKSDKMFVWAYPKELSDSNLEFKDIDREQFIRDICVREGIGVAYRTEERPLEPLPIVCEANSKIIAAKAILRKFLSNPENVHYIIKNTYKPEVKIKHINDNLYQIILSYDGEAAVFDFKLSAKFNFDKYDIIFDLINKKDSDIYIYMKDDKLFINISGKDKLVSINILEDDKILSEQLLCFIKDLFMEVS